MNRSEAVMKLSSRSFWVSLFTVALISIPFATTAETFRLTAGGPQSASLPWIGVIQTLVVPESNRRLSAAGSEHEIVWREAYGGSLYKWQNSLEAIEIGLTDIGWVGALWETSKMPLQNVTYYTPFVTDDLVLLLDLFNDLHERMPSLAAAWHDQNQVLLGASGVDTYHLMTTFPIDTIDDLEGRKILAPGPSATWLGRLAAGLARSLKHIKNKVKISKMEGTTCFCCILICLFQIVHVATKMYSKAWG